MHLNTNSMELGDYIKSDLLHDVPVPVHDLDCLNHINTLLAAYDTVLDHNIIDNRCELACCCAIVNRTSHGVVAAISYDTNGALLHITAPVTCWNVLPKILDLGPDIWPELRKYANDDVCISYTGQGIVGIEVVRKFKSQPLAVPNF